MKYIIEIQLGKDRWERSWSFGGVYMMDEAQGLLDNSLSDTSLYNYRITPLVTPRKPYRRHASITQLELRGAKAMLNSAMKHLIAPSTATWTLLIDAYLAVTRQLEKM
jgi:hypothetical protein